MKKKKFYFKVKLCIKELSSVPLVSGILFTKIGVKRPSSFKDYTNRLEVRNHCITWNKAVEFDVKIKADPQSGILQPVTCRLSVRKEVSGGRSIQKLGYIDLNLSEFAGQGSMVRNYILEGYSDSHRLDNSTLSIGIHMSLTSGDPLFKVPTAQKNYDQGISEDRGELIASSSQVNMEPLPGNNINGAENRVSLSCATSEAISLTQRTGSIPSQASDIDTPSSISALTAGGHVRTASLDCTGHTRSYSSGSAKAFLSLRKPGITERDQRIDSTRVDTSDVVDELLDKVSLDDSSTAKGLKLYIGKDGSASVTGHASGST